MDFGMIELQARLRQEELLDEARQDRRARAAAPAAPAGAGLPTPRAIATLAGIVALVVALTFGSGLAGANPDTAVAGGGNAIGYVP